MTQIFLPVLPSSLFIAKLVFGSFSRSLLVMLSPHKPDSQTTIHSYECSFCCIEMDIDSLDVSEITL